MKTFTNADIRSWNPCYDPIKYFPDSEIHTAVSILKNNEIPFEDRLWCVLRTELISERTMRLFACRTDFPELKWGLTPGKIRLDQGFHSKEHRFLAKDKSPHKRIETLFEREKTPDEFKDILLDIARSVK